jgi:sulfofructose kinase
MVALTRLGHTAAIFANVGGVVGKCIRRDFERHGVDCTHLIDIPGTQSLNIVALAEKSTGGRSFIVFKNPVITPETRLEDLSAERVLVAEWLLISDVRAPSAEAARWYKEAGRPVVMDGDSLHKNDASLFYLIDHLIISSYTYKYFFGESADHKNNLHELRKMQHNDKAVTVVTLGGDGLAGIDETGKYFTQSAYSVGVVDTTGAGDVFHGAYIAGKLDGMDTRTACHFAQAVSAIKCTKLGGRAGIPTRAQVLEFMTTGFFDFPELEDRAAYYRENPFERMGLK